MPTIDLRSLSQEDLLKHRDWLANKLGEPYTVSRKALLNPITMDASIESMVTGTEIAFREDADKAIKELEEISASLAVRFKGSTEGLMQAVARFIDKDWSIDSGYSQPGFASDLYRKRNSILRVTGTGLHDGFVQTLCFLVDTRIVLETELKGLLRSVEKAAVGEITGIATSSVIPSSFLIGEQVSDSGRDIWKVKHLMFTIDPEASLIAIPPIGNYLMIEALNNGEIPVDTPAPSPSLLNRFGGELGGAQITDLLTELSEPFPFDVEAMLSKATEVLSDETADADARERLVALINVPIKETIRSLEQWCSLVEDLYQNLDGIIDLY